MSEISLRTLLDRLPEDWARLAHGTPDPATPISGITEDSRRVGPGVLFVARRGRGTDGHRYVAQAVQAGAAGIVGELAPDELPAPLPEGMPYWQIADGRGTFALLSAAFFDYPSRRMTVIGVTGTDGKTTTSTLVHSVLTAAGIPAGLLTTIAAYIGGEALDTGFHVTTPEAFDLQSYLARMVAAGCQAAVLETTSHALDQQRVACVDYDVAVATNVTHEHLDWHGSWEAYLAAKARLFQALATAARKPGVPKAAVLNRDDRSYAPLLDVTHADEILTYSASGDPAATCTARDIALSREGTRFVLQTPLGVREARLRLLGRYNVANALAAACAGLALGLPLDAIVAGLGAVERIKGRMEWVYAGDFDVVVDFAHTPNALQETLALARALVRPGGRVIAVFGSAGLRDVAKRRMMGEIAAAGADLSVVTAEDPRTEDVNAIIEEIAGGLEAHGKREGEDAGYLRVAERGEAIALAIGLALPGDLIVTCGKSHETTMCYGTTETPWDEFAAIRAGLARRGIEPDGA
ncbi:MAG TPA: UDP-N-acetylmuramoyl-L-alanyl-D-glutamate--2,6-diaminopimelate ligase [Ktedonobacterales bacterium]|nr:UDP-N-acetylmuramoyl-L-alanyl-D-glutamate--2,6-diaminopimelate ligase [Ktedonobacterales bacterium]